MNKYYCLSPSRILKLCVVTPSRFVLETKEKVVDVRQSDKTNKRRTCEEQSEDGDQLVESVAENVLHHGARDEGLGSSVRLSQQKVLRGQFRGEGERGQRVHDQVHPQHLHRL